MQIDFLIDQENNLCFGALLVHSFIVVINAVAVMQVSLGFTVQILYSCSLHSE